MTDSSGKIINGFPQNKIGQQATIEKKDFENQGLSNGQILVITNAYPNNPSLIIFGIKISAENSGISHIFTWRIGFTCQSTEYRLNDNN